jgi:hypothetical protein
VNRKLLATGDTDGDAVDDEVAQGRALVVPVRDAKLAVDNAEKEGLPVEDDDAHL